MVKKNIALCSTLNDEYFKGAITFFESLLTHNPDLKYPYYIFSSGDLSEDNKQYLKTIYDKIIFKDINNSLYNNIKYSTKWRTWTINCCNRFDILSLTQYDRLVFFDVDMLVMDNLDNLFEYEGDFCACEEPRSILIDHPAAFNASLKTFNGGLMLISKKYLNTETQNALIAIAMQKHWSSDEPILNTFFTNDKVTFLPANILVTLHGITKENFSSAKIIHFLGNKKPWNEGSMEDRYEQYSVKYIKDNSLLIKVDLKFKQYYNRAIKKYNEYRKNSSNSTTR